MPPQPLTPEQELFYDDFLSAKLLGIDALNRLVEATLVIDDRVTDTVLELVNDDEIGIATVKINTRTTPPQVIIQFAGCNIERSLEALRSDLQVS